MEKKWPIKIYFFNISMFYSFLTTILFLKF